MLAVQADGNEIMTVEGLGYNLVKGSTHGLCHNLTQLAYFRPSNRHPDYENLYFVGPEIFGPHADRLVEPGSVDQSDLD